MGKHTEHDVEFIRALAELLRETDLAEVEVEREYSEGNELKVRLSKFSSTQNAAPVYASMQQVAPPLGQPQQQHYDTYSTPHSNTAAASIPDTTQQPNPDIDPAKQAGMVPSPMVGTVYLAAEPNAAPFVKEGDTVTKGQTLMIVEAMKTMNPISSPTAGTIKHVFVEDAQPVEFGTPLIVIE